MDETKAPPQKIKVVDRRKFTSDGDPRADSAESRDTVAPDKKPTQVPDHPQADPGPAERTVRETETPSSSKEPHGGLSSRFLELVAMLAGQAEILMVGAEGVPAQPADAKRLIDYLGVLEEKTAGNLSQEEGRALSNILYHLRSLYLQASS